MRKKIFDILNSIYPTYAVGQHENECISPYLVLRFNNQDRSITGALGGFQIFEVLVYVPYSSISDLDDLLENIKIALISDNSIESTDNITPDFRDTTVHAYMRSIKFRCPKGL